MVARVIHASYHKGRYEAALKCFSYLMETAVMTTYKIDPIVADLVLEHVHPSNWHVLPPSPEMMALKARQIGLITQLGEALFRREQRWGYYPTSRGTEYQARYGWVRVM